MPIEDFALIEVIGKGSFGKVHRARHKATGTMVAMKFIEKKSKKDKEIQSIRREIEILTHLQHENIICMFDAFETEHEFVVVMEFARGELFDVLEDDKTLPETEVRKIAKQLVRALHYLHMNRIIHRDMKPQNILLGKNGIVKLCDFGFARAMSQQTIVLTSIKGTPIYMAPELVYEQPYNQSVDLWSLGCILYELYYGKPPFFTQNIYALIDQIKKDPVTFPEPISPELKSFLKGLLTKNAAQRLNWSSGLLSHPFVRDSPEDARERSYVVAQQRAFRQKLETLGLIQIGIQYVGTNNNIVNEEDTHDIKKLITTSSPQQQQQQQILSEVISQQIPSNSNNQQQQQQNSSSNTSGGSSLGSNNDIRPTMVLTAVATAPSGFDNNNNTLHEHGSSSRSGGGAGFVRSGVASTRASRRNSTASNTNANMLNVANNNNNINNLAGRLLVPTPVTILNQQQQQVMSNSTTSNVLFPSVVPSAQTSARLHDEASSSNINNNNNNAYTYYSGNPSGFNSTVNSARLSLRNSVSLKIEQGFNKANLDIITKSDRISVATNPAEADRLAEALLLAEQSTNSAVMNPLHSSVYLSRLSQEFFTKLVGILTQSQFEGFTAIVSRALNLLRLFLHPEGAATISPFPSKSISDDAMSLLRLRSECRIELRVRQMASQSIIDHPAVVKKLLDFAAFPAIADSELKGNAIAVLSQIARGNAEGLAIISSSLSFVPSVRAMFSQGLFTWPKNISSPSSENPNTIRINNNNNNVIIVPYTSAYWPWRPCAVYFLSLISPFWDVREISHVVNSAVDDFLMNSSTCGDASVNASITLTIPTSARNNNNNNNQSAATSATVPSAMPTKKYSLVDLEGSFRSAICSLMYSAISLGDHKNAALIASNTNNNNNNLNDTTTTVNSGGNNNGTTNNIKNTNLPISAQSPHCPSNQNKNYFSFSTNMDSRMNSSNNNNNNNNPTSSPLINNNNNPKNNNGGGGFDKNSLLLGNDHIDYILAFVKVVLARTHVLVTCRPCGTMFGLPDVGLLDDAVLCLTAVYRAAIVAVKCDSGNEVPAPSDSSASPSVHNSVADFHFSNSNNNNNSILSPTNNNNNKNVPQQFAVASEVTARLHQNSGFPFFEADRGAFAVLLAILYAGSCDNAGYSTNAFSASATTLPGFDLSPIGLQGLLRGFVDAVNFQLHYSGTQSVSSLLETAPIAFLPASLTTNHNNNNNNSSNSNINNRNHSRQLSDNSGAFAGGFALQQKAQFHSSHHHQTSTVHNSTTTISIHNATNCYNNVCISMLCSVLASEWLQSIEWWPSECGGGLLGTRSIIHIMIEVLQYSQPIIHPNQQIASSTQNQNASNFSGISATTDPDFNLEDAKRVAKALEQNLTRENIVEKLFEAIDRLSITERGRTFDLLMRLVTNSSKFMKEFTENGGLDPARLQSLLLPHSPCRGDALTMLCHLSRNSKDSYVAIDGASIYPSLLQILQRDASEVFRGRVCNLVGNLCKHNASLYPALKNAGLVNEMVVRCWANREPDDNVRKFACFAVGNAAFHNDSLYPDLIQVVPALIQLLRAGDDKARQNAAGALGNLVRNGNSLVPVLNQNQASEALLQAFESPESSLGLRRNVAFSLGTLAQVEECKTQISVSRLKNAIQQNAREIQSDGTFGKYIQRLKQKIPGL